MPRISRGRRKIAMKKIENETNLQVTFSKRRTGLFKKASELCTLSGAEMAIVVFSPGKKPYSFGHPNVESIIERYLSGSHQPLNNSSTAQAARLIEEANRNATLSRLNEELTLLYEMRDEELRKGEELLLRERAGQHLHWREKPKEELDTQQLMWLKMEMQELHRRVAQETQFRQQLALFDTTDNLMNQQHFTNPMAPFFAGIPSTSSQGAMNNDAN
ncbi:agamous-like MADS-box protein AGL62 [Rosa sericea]